MTRAVVTGATGFIGRHLVNRLLEDGCPVTAVVRPESRRAVPEGAERCIARCTAADLAPFVRGAGTLFHVAGATSAATERAFMRANAEATREVARAARDAGAKLVFVSSQAAAGPSPVERPRTESDPPAPVSAYGRSKLAGEAAIRETAGLEWTIVRPVAVYGPGDAAFLTLFKLARRGVFPIVGRRDAAYQLVHVSDLVAGIAAAGRPGVASGQTLFVGHPAVHRADAILAALGEAVGRRCRPIPVPAGLVWALAVAGEAALLAGWPAALHRSRARDLTSGGFVCRVDLARELLGLVPAIDLGEGFAQTARWYREHGTL